jgi:hypothetical protein
MRFVLDLIAHSGYTHPMKKCYSVLLLLLLMLNMLSACTPGHVGTNVIAFVRDGQLWTIDPDGANAFAVVKQDTPVISYSWSPNHHLLTFRALDATFAKTAAARQLARNAITGQIGDAPSTENTIGVDGGSPITIALSSSDVFYSDAMWNPAGTRLLFRQTPRVTPRSPDESLWWVSQNDQPGGIAIKSLPPTYAIPSFSYSSNLSIGNSPQGLFTTTIAGSDLHYLAHTPLAGHPLPASLERVLWQPGHAHPGILYALSTSSTQAFRDGTYNVQLTLRSPDGQATTLTNCICSQFAWSPDGNEVLYSVGSSYSVLKLSDHSSFTTTGESDSIPYWSPDGRFLLLDGTHTLTLVLMKQQQSLVLLRDNNAPNTANAPMVLPPTNALLQPLSNSLWASDSRHFVFQARERSEWLNKAISGGKGLYTIALDNNGHAQGSPVLVDRGNDSQPGWTYQDPNTSFLF